MSKHIIEDAHRCLQCKNPQCSMGCPVATPIRDAIQMLLESRIADAGRMLFENNPLSLVCCHVCPQENQCEGHCVLGRTGSPVQISAIERYISDYYLNIHRPRPSRKTAGRIAVIGSGPAGITIAFLLAKRDYDVTIFEANDRIGGVLRYGIPEFRLPKSILDRLADTLTDTGIKIRPNTSIGANLTVDELFRDEFRAIFMGTGVWRPSKLGVKGESLGNVHYAIEYLRNPNVYRLGEHVLVIGAGNVAMDVARSAFRHGAQEVTILLSGDERAITAREIELKYAQIDGARLQMNKAVKEFVDGGAIVVDTAIDEDLVPRPIAGTERFLGADSTIIAIGQGPRAVIVQSTTGIEVGASGLVAVDEDGRTSRPGVFASGDVVTGAKTVVEAVRISKRVADAMDRYVKSLR